MRRQACDMTCCGRPEPENPGKTLTIYSKRPSVSAVWQACRCANPHVVSLMLLDHDTLFILHFSYT